MIGVALTIFFVIIFFAIRMMIVEALAGFFQDRRYYRQLRREARQRERLARGIWPKR